MSPTLKVGPTPPASSWALAVDAIASIRTVSSAANVGMGSLEIRASQIVSPTRREVVQRIYRSDGSWFEQLADSGLTTYFVSVDFPDEREQVVNFLTTHGVTGLSFIKDEKDMPFINGVNENWTGAVPYTVIYGRADGRVISFWEGAANKAKFSSAASEGLSN